LIGAVDNSVMMTVLLPGHAFSFKSVLN
jgi:hypothetical protein